jgi:hypothetical protein
VAIIAQTAFAASISKKCTQEIMELLEEDVDMADFTKDLATTVAKVQGAGAIAKVPILGSLLGPGSDNEMTDIGITVGCAKEIPKEPAKIKSLLKELVAEKAKNAVSNKFGAKNGNVQNNASPQKAATSSGSNKTNCIKTELKINANTLNDIVDACEVRRGEILFQISGSTNIGSCLKNDLDFDISIKQIKTQCGVDDLISSKSSTLDVASTAETYNLFDGSKSTKVSSDYKAPSSPKVTLVATPLTDYRDGKVYKTVVIGKSIWMAENLNYNVSGSKCYNKDNSNCVKYGRLYNWAAAMSFTSDCNSSNCANLIQPKHMGVCPDGWHLPDNDELESVGGRHFMILGGSGFLDGSYEGAGSYGNWWSSSANEGDYYSAYKYVYQSGKNFSKDEDDKNTLLSVRCVGD